MTMTEEDKLQNRNREYYLSHANGDDATASMAYFVELATA